MQTVVAVFSTIYGVAFNGRDMTPRENRDTALALKRAFDCIPTPAWLWRGLTLCSACSRDERTMGPRGPDVFNREQEHETGGARQKESTQPQSSGKSGCRYGHTMGAQPR
ncbi:hypothetical protein CGC21_30580 [Leishmania donovani]|uniref:Uncharacterized protein n=1 Tax=Leishmania donovani TaxID=5661 RepID=A0A504XGL0_LEIDO|nr:hypothetical protein CGC21_30580 [Leishmania donovani]